MVCPVSLAATAREIEDVRSAVARGEMTAQAGKRVLGLKPDEGEYLDDSESYAAETARREYNAASAFARAKNEHDTLQAKREKALNALPGAWPWQRAAHNRTLSETAPTLRESESWLTSALRRNPDLDSVVTKSEDGQWIVDLPQPARRTVQITNAPMPRTKADLSPRERKYLNLRNLGYSKDEALEMIGLKPASASTVAPSTKPAQIQPRETTSDNPVYGPPAPTLWNKLTTTYDPFTALERYFARMAEGSGKS